MTPPMNQAKHPRASRTAPKRPAPRAVLTNQLQDPDGFYEALLDAHAGLSTEQSALLHAKLVLLLANQIGDASVLAHCIEMAKPLACEL